MTRTPHPHRARGAQFLTAAGATVALVLVIVLSPDASRVEASSTFSGLRLPGETAFVAGHRGDKAAAPENTIPAFERALASDAAYLETDLQLTSDGVPVLIHDRTLDHTTTGAGPVWDATWDEVRRLDAGSWYSPGFTGVRVPRLSELLDLLVPTDKGLLLELKGAWSAEQLAPVAEQIRSRNLVDRVIIASFDILSLAAMRDTEPRLQRIVISRTIISDPAILAATCGAVALATSRGFLQDDPDVVVRIHAAGLGVLVYTLNSEKSWSEAVSLGVDGIITDKPADLDGWLAEAGAVDSPGGLAHD